MDLSDPSIKYGQSCHYFTEDLYNAFKTLYASTLVYNSMHRTLRHLVVSTHNSVFINCISQVFSSTFLELFFYLIDSIHQSYHTISNFFLFISEVSILLRIREMICQLQFFPNALKGATWVFGCSAEPLFLT